MCKAFIERGGSSASGNRRRLTTPLRRKRMSSFFMTGRWRTNPSSAFVHLPLKVSLHIALCPLVRLSLFDELNAAGGKRKRTLPKGTDQLNDFTTMILDHLNSSGVQQAKRMIA